MSDYSYCVIHKQPPRPRVGVALRIWSWFKPVRGWTTGVATSMSGGVGPARAEWVIHRGRVRPASRVGLVHTCSEGSTCYCNTGRQFEGDSDE